MIVNPEVHCIAATSWVEEDGEPEVLEQFMETDAFSTEAEDVIEFAGRACYQSFHKPNPATRRNEDYIRNIINQGHFSVLEHSSATFYITGVSRAFTHELIRHRHLSFSQLSQRFVNEGEANIVLPPAVRESKETVVYEREDTWDDLKGDLTEALEWWSHDYTGNYNTVVEVLEHEGLSRKQAREAARAALPNMVETRIVVTGNMRAWREFLDKRLRPEADAEMQEVAQLILDQLLIIAPTVFEEYDT